MAYGDFKYLTRRTGHDKILHDIKYIAKNSKYDGYQQELASMVFNNFFYIKTSGSGT